MGMYEIWKQNINETAPTIRSSPDWKRGDIYKSFRQLIAHASDKMTAEQTAEIRAMLEAAFDAPRIK
jgi:hypothetical protein